MDLNLGQLCVIHAGLVEYVRAIEQGRFEGVAFSHPVEKVMDLRDEIGFEVFTELNG